MNPPPVQSEVTSPLVDPHYQATLPSDVELLDLYVLGGQTQALITLLSRFTPMMTGVIRRVVSHPQDAEDAFQATCVILMQSAKKIRSRRSIAAWLYGVAYRTACRVRSKSRRQATGLDPLELPDEQSTDDPIEKIVRQIELSNLDRELQNLPAAYRDPLVEHYILGMTAREIAERMELSSSAVEGRLRRGRHMLRERLAERGASLSICVAGVTWMRNQRQTTTDSQALTENFVHSRAFQVPESLSINDPYLFQLVEGETKMQVATLLKSAGFLTAFAGVTISLTVAALAMQTNGTPNRRGQPAGGSANGVQAVTATEDPTTTQVVEAAEVPVNRQGPQANPRGGNQRAEEVIRFAKPTNPAPRWLKAGGEDMVAVEKTRDALREPVDVDFHGVPLRQVMDEFANACGVSFVIDETTLAESGQSPDEPVVISAAKMPLNQALALILFPRNLSYEVHPNIIKITDIDSVEPGVRYYDLSHVLPSSAGVGNITQSALALIEPNDPEPTISIIGSMMIARCQERSHLEIEKLLSEVAKLSPDNLPNNESQAKSGGVFKPDSGGGMGGGGMGMGGMFRIK